MNILTYGGGTNSTSLAIECVKRSIPIDLIIFADTGGEKPATYVFIKMFDKWLVKHGMPAITRVQTVNINGTYITLEQQCLNRKQLPAIAYGRPSCSDKHKVRPVDKFLNNWPRAKLEWEAGRKIVKFIGFDADEPQRAKDFDSKKYNNRYPLIEWDMGRDECIDTIKSVGLELPGKSSCFYCPHMRKQEIRQLKIDNPELLDRALRLESNAELTSVKGLGRNYAWADLLATDAINDEFENRQLELPCGCYDG